MITYLKLLLTAVFWGGTFVAGRSLAQHVEPFSAAFFRFAVASVFLVLLSWKIEGPITLIRKRQILAVFFLGLTGVFCYNLFFFKGLKLIEASRAAIIIANNPIFIIRFLIGGIFFISVFSARCSDLSGFMKVSIKSGQPKPGWSLTLFPSVRFCWHSLF